MTGPVKNTCTPDEVFGPINHTLFLGCSVEGFSASVGFNGQQTELTVQLVEDCAPAEAESPKIYYDEYLQEQEWTDPDPGFYGLESGLELVGAPVYFRVNNFEFSGIVQSWTEDESESGRPVYTVKIVDPSKFLSNSQLIINDYSGSVNDLYNIFNLYGYLESFGFSCPQRYQSSPACYLTGTPSPLNLDGAVFGSDTNTYGSANINTNGLQWEQMLGAIKASIASYDGSGQPLVDNWTPYGRIVFRGPGTVPTEYMGLLDEGDYTGYMVDLDEMPEAPTYWRFNGLNMSLLDVISQMCEDAGHDYMIELIPVVKNPDTEDAEKPKLFIRLRAIDRTSEPTANSLDTFIEHSSNEGRIISSRKGKELRNEQTEAMVIGGPKQSVYQAERVNCASITNIIMPFFGTDPDTGDALIPTQDASGFWQVEVPTRDLKFQLSNSRYSKTIPDTLVINEREMIMCQSGYDSWSSYASYVLTPLWVALNFTDLKGVFHPEFIVNLVNDLPDVENFRAADYIATAYKVMTDHDDKDLEAAQIAFAWLGKIVSDHYGKDYMVRVPYVCAREDLLSGKIFLSEQPSDGGWTEFNDVLELNHPSAATDFFSLPDNRLGAFCRFDAVNKLEITSLSYDDFITDQSKVWVKLDVETSGYVFEDASSYYNPAVVVSLPQPIREADVETDPRIDFGSWIKMATDFKTDNTLNPDTLRAKFLNTLRGIGAMDLHEGTIGKAVLPDGVCCGLKSNMLTYGPWGVNGKPGAVNVIHDEGFVPWEYGGTDVLNAAGEELALQGLTDQQEAETGQVRVVGYPNVPLGSELLAGTSGPYAGETGPNLVENRDSVRYNLSFFGAPAVPCLRADMPKWDGTYGPIVTNILVRGMNESGAETTYNIQTWTPRYGIFARNNVERLKQFGIKRLRDQKMVRSYVLQRVLAISRDINRGHFRRGGHPSPNQFLWFLSSRWGYNRGTPSEVIGGQLLQWNDETYQRPVVATMPVHELGVEIASDYDKKAFCSWDAILRPVSLNGSGDLPQVINPIDNCQKTISLNGQTPIDKSGEAGSFNQYNLDIDEKYLNPYSNANSDLTTERSDTPDHGHDIELVARGSNPPDDSMFLSIQGAVDNGNDPAEADYASDYRTMAIKGPMLIQQWGYDLDGKPVPNLVDTDSECRSGNFESEDLQDKFLDNWLRKPETWPVAPLDLRLDRQRGVWTIPRIPDIVVTLQVDIDPNESGLAVREGGATLYDADGIEIENPEMIVYDRVGNYYSEGDKVIVRFDPDECEYYIIEAAACKQVVQVVTDVYETDDAIVIEKANITVCDYEELYSEEIELTDCEDYGT